MDQFSVTCLMQLLTSQQFLLLWFTTLSIAHCLCVLLRVLPWKDSSEEKLGVLGLAANKAAEKAWRVSKNRGKDGGMEVKDKMSESIPRWKGTTLSSTPA